jgi:hypothetical protein
MFTVGHPAGEIYDATKSTAARLVPITGPTVDRLVADHPYFVKATIPGGLYLGNDSPTPTFGVRATLVATAETPDDVVYLVVKSVFENFEEFKNSTRRSRTSIGAKWRTRRSPPRFIRVPSATTAKPG